MTAAEEMENASIREVYARRIAADLERNRAEQEEIGERIAALRARLERLRADERWLAGLHRDTDTTQPATETARTEAHHATPGDGTSPGEGADASLPTPPQEEPTGQTTTPADTAPTADTTPADTAPTPSATTSRGRPARKTTARKAAAKKEGAAKRRGGPSLRELAHGCLTTRGEPRSAAEITRELQAAHPERSTSVQLVRNALEKLVATGAAERSKQGANVFYTPVAQPAATGDAGQADERQAADGDIGQASARS